MFTVCNVRVRFPALPHSSHSTPLHSLFYFINMCRMQFAGCDKGILGRKARNCPSKLNWVALERHIIERPETAWEKVNWCVRKAGCKKNARNGPWKEIVRKAKARNCLRKGELARYRFTSAVVAGQQQQQCTINAVKVKRLIQ